MDRFAILATLEAKPGKESEVEAFLKSALPLVFQETETTTWFALRISQTTFGIFDTFSSEEGRQAHLSGEIAKALMSKADELFSKSPRIELVDVIEAKPLN